MIRSRIRAIFSGCQTKLVHDNLECGTQWHSNPVVRRAVLPILIAVTFFLVGLDKVNEASDPGYGDTMPFLQVALFIKDNGGVSNFLHLCMSGEYKADVQKPLYPVLLAMFASRELVFFPRARVLSLVMGLLVVVAFFYISRDLYGDDVAYLGAGALAVNETFLRVSSHVQCETTLILFMLLSLYCMMKGFVNERYWMMAGLFGGLAYMTKGTGLILIPVFAIATLLSLGPKIMRRTYFWMFFVLFFLISSPLIARNMLLHGEPTYESANHHAIWLDSWEEIFLPKYQLIRQFPEVTWEGNALPTMKSYIASHSLSEIITRAATGVSREFRMFLGTMEPLIYIEGIGRLMFLFFCIGLALEISTQRILYVVFFMAGIFFPFAWMNQSVPADRFISVLIPFVCMYSAIGFTRALTYLDNTVFQKILGVTTRKGLPVLLGVFFVLIAGYVLVTQEVHLPGNPAPLSEDFNEISTWLGTTVHNHDLVLLGATNPYHVYAWHVGLRGKIAIWRPEMSVFEQGGVQLLNRILENKRAGPGRYVIIHKDDVLRSNFLANHFTYDGVNGIRELQPIEGWKLVYKHSQKPTMFLIYQKDKTVVGSSEVGWDPGLRTYL